MPQQCFSKARAIALQGSGPDLLLGGIYLLFAPTTGCVGASGVGVGRVGAGTVGGGVGAGGVGADPFGGGVGGVFGIQPPVSGLYETETSKGGGLEETLAAGVSSGADSLIEACLN